MLSDEPSPSSSLPAHLAARFARKPKAIRRSSAASSRRSSISSLHSQHSNVASAPTDHIAQHLRRASILESRKARLADRALHAEKVRLRAALTKAATRNLQREGRALAAQQARERLLAEITAKCEEEVRRAKKKAEDNREKKAAEHARLRLEMAEKLVEVEKRRLLYQQTPRQKTVTATMKHLSEDAAARKIQRAWKSYYQKAIIREFFGIHISTERIREMTFEEVGTLFSEEDVLSKTARVLRLCGLQDMESGTVGGRGAVRTFLSSYLIVTHPAEVLSGDGEQEQDLIFKARGLLSAFEQVTPLLASACCSPVSISTELQTLCEEYNVFFSAFHAWKTHDSSVLIEIMLAQFIELELIWQTVKDDKAGGVADDYRQGIRQNQILLLARLKRLAGPDRAMQMVRDALRKAKRQKKKSASKRAIPRSAEVASAATTTETLTESVASPISESFNNVDNIVLHELEKQRVSPHERFTRILTALPENRALVHELLIDKEFKIEERSYIEPRRQIIAHMCSLMRRDVEAGMGTNWIVAMATVIQDRLLRSLRPGNSLHVLISEVLDPKLVENQCKAGAFSYDTFFHFMNTILPRLCAPYRDPVVQAFTEDTSGDGIDRLARLMGMIDLLSLDHTNFMIQVAAPQLIQEAPGYEQRTFERGLQDGSLGLGKTRRFWRKHRKIIAEEMRKRDPENIQGEPQPPASKVYAHGLVDLVFSNTPVFDVSIPETMELDRQRLNTLHAQAFKMVATASILLTAKNLLKRDARAQWKAEADRILSLDFNDVSPDRIQTILESTHPMPQNASAQLAATIKRVLSPVAAAYASVSHMESQTSLEVHTEIPRQVPLSSSESMSSTTTPSTTVNGATSFTDPVARLILSRLRAHVLSRLSATSASERVRATSTASQSLAGAGMPEFVNQVGQLTEELDKLREVDWVCHGMVYERILAENNSPVRSGA
ncbi:T-complex protein 11-domain-containing protein [Aspergillus crustosus]